MSHASSPPDTTARSLKGCTSPGGYDLLGTDGRLWSYFQLTFSTYQWLQVVSRRKPAQVELKAIESFRFQRVTSAPFGECRLLPVAGGVGAHAAAERRRGGAGAGASGGAGSHRHPLASAKRTAIGGAE
jgi:hypothetical protein